MMDLLSHSWLTIALPVVILVGSLLVSKLLKLSLIGTIIAACLPLGLPFIELPFSELITHRNPEYLIGAGWLVLLSVAVGWILVRPLASAAVQSFGIVKLSYCLVLAAALVVVALLLSDSKLLNTYAPGWRGTAGIVLLCASLLSMSFALARFFKAAVFLALWSFVSLVLASEILLGKLPQKVLRGDIKQIEQMFPSQKLNAVLKGLGVEDEIARVKEVVLQES